MNEHELDELIENWLLGSISPEDRARLEDLIARDPDVYRRVKESQGAYQAILAAHRESMRNKLTQLDAAIDRARTKRVWWIILLALLGLTILALVVLLI